MQSSDPNAVAESGALLRRLRAGDASHPGRFRAQPSKPQHGGDARAVTLDQALVVSPEPDTNLVALHDALKTLAELDPRQAQVDPRTTRDWTQAGRIRAAH